VRARDPPGKDAPCHKIHRFTRFTRLTCAKRISGLTPARSTSISNERVGFVEPAEAVIELGGSHLKSMSDSFAIRKRSRSGREQERNGAASFFRGLELDLVERIEFFQAFIREPVSVGALSPSSRALARAMIQGCNLQDADTVVEMGPGTGAFTGLIRERIGKETTFVAIELERNNARCLKRRFPDLIVHNDSAERMPEYLAQHRKKTADVIISGIPWANLQSVVQDRIMNGVMASLASDGVFTTFGYVHARWLPNARRFRQMLECHFVRVETSSVIWGNFPPAFVYRCAQSGTSPAAASGAPSPR